MKTSELIKRLQYFANDVPFDAEVVMGDDWQPTKLKKVYHEPPHTFLEFESTEERYDLDSSETVLVHSFLASVLERYKEGGVTREHAVSILADLLSAAQLAPAEEIIEYIKCAQ